MKSNLSLIKSDKVTRPELYLGYFLGPFAVMLMNSILTNYLNVYYTDVLGLSSLWGGAFLSGFPLVVKAIDAFTFILMGIIVEKFHFKSGKARPWILISAPLLVLSMISLFAVPKVNDIFTIIWIFISYNLFYSVAYTIYNTAHVLMIPLSTEDYDDRRRLSVIANCQGMLSGSLVAVFFPTIILPRIDTNESLWILIMTIVAIGALPFILMEFFFTRERVTEKENIEELPTVEKHKKSSLIKDLKKCFKSRKWVLFMVFLIGYSLVNNLANSSVFYYCNWVLGSYNDGKTQMLFYVIGNMPLGYGIFFARRLAKKVGTIKLIIYGYILATIGIIVCLINPYNLVLVLIGQLIKSTGLIPVTFLQSSLLADSLDDVKKVNGSRGDGASSAVYNVIHTVTVGLSLFVLNFGLSFFGYVIPADNPTMTQSLPVQIFFIIIALGLQAIAYPLMIVLFHFYKKVGKDEHQEQQKLSK